MSTYQQEQKFKNRDRAKRAPKYTFKATGFDLSDRRRETPKNGTVVIKVQPHGCPQNGTMGMCFVADGKTGEFICLVDQRSLVPVEKGSRKSLRVSKNVLH